MASITDIVLNKSLEPPEGFTQGGGAVATGLKLAATVQQIQGQKVRLDAQKQALAEADIKRTLGWFDKLSQTKSLSTRNAMLKAMNGELQRMGRQGIDPILSERFRTDEDAILQRSKMIAKRLVESGQFSPELAEGIARSLADDENYTQSLLSIESDIREEERKSQKEAALLEKEDLKVSQREEDKLFQVSKEFNSRITKEKIPERLDAIQNLRTLLTGGAISLNQAKFIAAKAAQGGGVLTDKDIDRLGGSQAVFDRLKRMIGLATEGKPLNPEDIKEFQDIADASEANLLEKRDQLVESFVTSQAKIFPSIGEERIRGALSIPGALQSTPIGKSSKVSTIAKGAAYLKTIPNMTAERATQLLKKANPDKSNEEIASEINKNFPGAAGGL